MALGLIPGTVVGIIFLTALIGWGLALPGLVDDWTPFADTWNPFWADVVRTAIGVASFGAALLVVVVSFTAVTLAVGEPVYDRIWRATERSATGTVPDAHYGFWRAIGDSVRLILRGILAAALAWLIGLVPFVGGVLGFATGVVLTGWLLADELTSRSLSARGFDRRARRAITREHRARALGFGVATQLCFLVPLGAVAVMPAAVAGSTLWTLSALDGRRALGTPAGTGPAIATPDAPAAPRAATPTSPANRPADPAR